MLRPWQILLVLFVAGLAFAASVTWALVVSGDSSAEVRGGAAAPGPGADRTNCDEIYGTAYRSNSEREWFSNNCSAWSRAVGDLPLSDPPASLAAPGGREPSSPPPNGRDCNQIRGRPYLSDAERDWYLASCGPNPRPSQQQASAGADRTDCNEIRGTAYRSDNERRWYQQNCAANSQPSGQRASAGADRSDCDQIRGTAYRSETERRWYQQNCSPR